MSLIIKDLIKKYGDKTVVDKLSFVSVVSYTDVDSLERKRLKELEASNRYTEERLAELEGIMFKILGEK